jgi:hypothetical protein
LPDAIVSGKEPLSIIGAIAAGQEVRASPTHARALRTG